MNADPVPRPRRPLSKEELVARAASLPPVDPAELRADVDALLDTRFLPEP